MTYRSKVNLNIPQFPNTGDSKLDEALRPIHNALRLLQDSLQGTDDIASASNSVATNINELFQAHLIGHVTEADIPASSLVRISPDSNPSFADGNINDIWINKKTGSVFNKVAVVGWEYLGKLSVQPVTSNEQPMTWKGTWLISKAYDRQSVVAHPDTGAIYMALVNVPAGLVNKPPNAQWQLIQEGSTPVGEAVLSSRAPAPSGSPPNFVLSRVGSDIIYARV